MEYKVGSLKWLFYLAGLEVQGPALRLSALTPPGGREHQDHPVRPLLHVNPPCTIGWGDFLQKHASYCGYLGMTHKDKKWQK